MDSSLSQRRVTLYQSATLTQALDYPSVADVLAWIRTGRYKPAVERIRREANKERRQRLKKNTVPAVSFSGTFPQRANDQLREHSGFVRLDYDGLTDKAASRAGLASNPYTLAVWDSVSGDLSQGLSVLVHFDPIPRDDAEHKVAFEAARVLFDLPAFDEIVKGVSWLTYMSYDPDLYVNWEAKPIPVDYAATPQRRQDQPAFRGELNGVIPDGQKYKTLRDVGAVLRGVGLSKEMIATTLHALHESHGETVGEREPIDRLADWLGEKEYNPDQALASFRANVIKGLPTSDEIAATKSRPRIADTLAANDPFSLEEASCIYERVYEVLPAMLREACLSFEQQHERDVFLTGALPSLASCMPNVRGSYGHNAELLTPNLYAGIIAGAAGGKGVLRWCERLVKSVDAYLRESSEREHAEWQDRQDYAQERRETFREPEPPRRSLILPVNTSTAALHKALADRGGRALLIETEIDTLVNALGQEWGKFDDSLRKAFHHEVIRYMRKNEEVSIPNPAVSLVLSGTPDQLRSLIRSTENGLYSRIALYYFEGRPVWVSQQPTASAAGREALFDRLGAAVKHLYCTLRGRQELLLFEMEQAHWDLHVETFRPMMRRLYTIGRGHLDDIIKRAGVIAFRQAMTLRVFRTFDLGEDLTRMDRLRATDADVEAALWLACTNADHALRFSTSLKHQPAQDMRGVRIGRLLAELPDEFTSEQAYERAEHLGLRVGERTVQRDLNHAAGISLLERLGKSRWRQL